MIKIIIHLAIGIALVLIGILSYYLIKKRKKEFTFKRNLTTYFVESIPIILFVAGLLVIVLGFI